MTDLRDIAEVFESNNTKEVNRLLLEGWALLHVGIYHSTDTFRSGEPIYTSGLSFILGRTVSEEAQA